MRDVANESDFRAAHYTQESMTALCARLRQLLETPACVAADNCVLAILQNTNPVSLSDPGKAIIAGTGLLAAIQAVLPKFPGNVLIIWDAALIFKNCCLAPGPLRVDHAATVATACIQAWTTVYIPEAKWAADEEAPSELRAANTSLRDAIFCMERDMPGNKLVTVGVALQGLDTWCNSGSAASVLLHLLCDRVYLPHAEFLFGPHTLSKMVRAVSDFGATMGDVNLGTAMFAIANMHAHMGDCPRKAFLKLVEVVADIFASEGSSDRLLLASTRVIHHFSIHLKWVRALQELAMDLGVLRVLHAHKEDAGLVTECLRVLIYLARDVRNRVTVHDDVLAALATLQAAPGSLPSQVVVLAGEAFNGYSLATPATMTRCTNALAAAVEAAEGAEGAASGAVTFAPLATK